MTTYRNISNEEIEILCKNGCLCEDWMSVKVKDGFIAERVRNVSFSGNVFLGVFERRISFAGGIERYSGVYNATIHNCVIEDDVYINQIKNYITKFLGSGLVKKLEMADFSNEDEMRRVIAPSEKHDGTGEWIDMAGLLVPKKMVSSLIKAIENDSIASLSEINNVFHEWKDNYYKWSWNWIVEKLKIEENIDIESVSANQLTGFIEKWKSAVVRLDNMIYEDAKKEFTLKSQTSFGIDGKDKTRISDFEQVRGEFTSHPAVMEIIEHIDKKSKLADNVINKLKCCALFE